MIACPSSIIELCIPVIIFKQRSLTVLRYDSTVFTHLHINKPVEAWLTWAVARLWIESGSCRTRRRSLNCEIRYDQLPTHLDHVISQTVMLSNLITMHGFILTTGTSHNVQECKRCSYRRSEQNLAKQSVLSKSNINATYMRKKGSFSFIFFSRYSLMVNRQAYAQIASSRFLSA